MTAEKAYTVCVVADAAVIGEARRQACRFIRSECRHTRDTPEMMLPTALSPTFSGSPVHPYLAIRSIRPAASGHRESIPPPLGEVDAVIGSAGKLTKVFLSRKSFACRAH